MNNTPRPWRIRNYNNGGERVLTFPPFLVAGILNVTPDSFSDGGQHTNADDAIQHGIQLWKEGAGIIDIGGESTRPGSAPIDHIEEQRRVLPVLQGLLAWRNEALEYGADEPREHIVRQGERPHWPLLSIDTWRSQTALACLEAGAEIINDVSGASFDPAMLEAVAAFKPGYILGHTPARPVAMQVNPHYADVVEEVYRFCSVQMERLIKAGLPEECIMLDPGIGFGKNLEHNLAILRSFPSLYELGRPICLGISRKTFFSDLLGLPKSSAADAATQVVVALTAELGIEVHRVHAVHGAVNAIKIAVFLSKSNS